MFLELRLAGDLPPTRQIEFIAERILAQEDLLTRGVWLWADTRAAGREILKQLFDELGDAAESYTKTANEITLAKGGHVSAMIPRARPDGEQQIAVWMATSEIPAEYMSRLLGLGQCEEFWARPGTVPMWPDGSDWRKGQSGQRE